jgi:hypothetical protein
MWTARNASRRFDIGVDLVRCEEHCETALDVLLVLGNLLVIVRRGDNSVGNKERMEEIDAEVSHKPDVGASLLVENAVMFQPPLRLSSN